MAQRGGQLADDLAILGLVLRHTIVSGHGWGKSATPLHGFYVLDRTVPGIEDPDFNPDQLDDESVGAPISLDVKDSLLRGPRHSVADCIRLSIQRPDRLEASAARSVEGPQGLHRLGTRDPSRCC
jgi:hypothetical protein